MASKVLREFPLMTLKEFRRACAEYLQDPKQFGADALAHLLSDLAENISDDDLRKLAQDCVGWGRP